MPPIAAEFGLKVTVGVWLDKDEERNEREIRSAHRSRAHATATSTASWSATRRSLRARDRRSPTSSRLIQRVKRDQQPGAGDDRRNLDASGIDHPELASAVDFIAAHILPYWEGIPTPRARSTTRSRVYNKLRRRVSRQAHRDRRIRLAERRLQPPAMPSPAASSRRACCAISSSRAEALGIDYNIIEAFDQPWKTFEGSVGAYWGLFDATRAAEIRLDRSDRRPGPLEDRRRSRVAVGVLVSLPILAHGGRDAGAGAAARVRRAHASAPGSATVFEFWNGHYFVLGAAFALGLGVLLLIPLVADRAARGSRRSRRSLFGRGPRRLLALAGRWRRRLRAESVDPHSGLYASRRRCSRRRSMRSRGSTIRISNASSSSTTRPIRRCWQPIEEHCRDARRALQVRQRAEGSTASRPARCGSRWRTPRRDAEIIGIIDADYVVQSELAQRSRAGLRRSQGRPRAGAAGSPRRRPQRRCITP